MNNQIKPKKISLGLKVLVFILLSPIIAVLAIIVIILINSYIISPISNSFEIKKFEKIDSKMTALSEDVKEISKNQEVWNYDKKCEPDRSGPWSGGVYFCENIVELYQPVNSVSEVSDINDRYIGLILNHDFFTINRRFLPSYKNDTNITSFISSLDLVEKETGIECDFVSNVTAKKDIAINGDSIWSDKISLDNEGYIHVSIYCREKTSGAWY